MLHRPVTASDPLAWILGQSAQSPAQFFAPAVLDARLRAFVAGFPGRVTYAVKANPAEQVLAQLIAGGIHGFDVASPEEIRLIRRLSPGIALHYNNPVRTPAEIREGIRAGVASWSVDTEGELRKLLAAGLPPATEIAVRFRLTVMGATYDFGSKFGADPEAAASLLQTVTATGLTPALTFHVGTQCADPMAWDKYVRAAAGIARAAGVRIARLNVGGGFPSARGAATVDLAPFFAAISAAVGVFDHAPALVCEPGRGLVGDACSYGVQVRSIRPGRVYLDDGIYGGLAEFPSMGLPRFRVVSPQGLPRTGGGVARVVFGPTCDSLDRLPGEIDLPEDLAEGDWIVFAATGAYLNGLTTRFNGYGMWQDVTVTRLWPLAD